VAVRPPVENGRRVDATKFLSRLVARGSVSLRREASSGKVVAEFKSPDGRHAFSATSDDLDRAVFRLYEVVETNLAGEPKVWRDTRPSR
jgi:hypothetical protein